MSITFDKALGVHPQALALRLYRTELLSANLANVNTPRFEARDIDFKQELERAALGVGTTPQLQYRVPTQPARDGNTVSLEVEQTVFTQNVQEYQMGLAFLNMRFAGLREAIEGK